MFDDLILAVLMEAISVWFAEFWLWVQSLFAGSF